MKTCKLQNKIQLDKCEKILTVLWILCIASSYVCNDFLAIQIPYLGSIFPFRIILPVTVLVFLLYQYVKKDNFIKKSSVIEKWCYVFIAVFILYGGVSLLWAQDKMFTFKREFNVCLDMAFFLIGLILMRDKKLRRYSADTCFVCSVILCVFGLYEIINGSLVNELYNGVNKAEIFGKMYQYPVTFFSNTNDYSMALLFSFGVFCADYFTDAKPDKKRSIMLVSEAVCSFTVIGIASSRLCMLAFCAIFAALVLYYIVNSKKHIKYAAVIAVCMAFILLITNYASTIRKINSAFDLSLPTVLFYDEDGDHPVNKLGDSDLMEELFVEGEDGVDFNTKRSGGIRITLFLYALDCIKKTYGLGMGLGNTEYYSIDLGIMKNDEPLTAIHCFLARIAADYGIFIIIPLAAVAFLLIKKIFSKKSYCDNISVLPFIGNCLMWSALIAVFPIASTASADAQDGISMWLFLAVLFEIIDGLCKDKKAIKEIKE